jgi:hypothetical protein
MVVPVPDPVSLKVEGTWLRHSLVYNIYHTPKWPITCLDTWNVKGCHSGRSIGWFVINKASPSVAASCFQLSDQSGQRNSATVVRLSHGNTCEDRMPGLSCGRPWRQAHDGRDLQRGESLDQS